MSSRVLSVLTLSITLAAGSAPALGSEFPGPRRVEAKPVSHAAALQTLGHRSVPEVPESETEQTPEILQLARALRFDPQNIYEYVRNNIDYIPIYGCVKGATMTLLDGAGNDFDQTALFIALMRASGYTADFIYGQLSVNGNPISKWLQVENDATVVGSVLGSAGIPATVFVFGNGSLSHVELDHVWAKATIDSTEYVFDPSFKRYTIGGEIDLATAMGYDQATFLANAEIGATLGADYVEDINRANIRADLTTFTSNLITDIQANVPGGKLIDVVGGGEIITRRNDPFETTLSNEISRDFQWTDVPAAYKTTLRLQFMGIDETLASSDIYGKRLTLFFNGSNQPELRLDGAVLATGFAGTPGSLQSITFKADHPYAAFGGTYGDQSQTQSLVVGTSYVVANNWAGSNRGIVDKHQRILGESVAAGDPPLSEPVLGETLNVLALMWLAETSGASQLTDAVANTATIDHHTVGFTGQAAAPFIDIPMSLVSVLSARSDQDQTDASFFVQSGLASAMEWGIFDQLQPISAVSTIKLLDQANTQSDRIFDATLANFGSIQPQLVNYSAGEIASVQSFLNGGFRVILPQDGDLGELQWSGIGFLAVSGAEDQIAHIISGGLKGGFGTEIGDAIAEAAAKLADAIEAAQHALSNEPIDLVSGDYLYQQDDLVVGSAPFPFSLGFTRSYSSGKRLIDGPLGLGWTHNFDSRVSRTSDPFQGMGEDSPVDAAPAIVELFAALDLLSSAKTNENLVVASLAHRWFMDRLIDNVVIVQEPNGTWPFVELPDGSYSPPPGSVDTLTLEGDQTFLLETKRGDDLDFDADGRLATWQDVSGNTVTLTYNVDELASISNGMGRTLSLSYVANRISSVSDGTGRMVSFGYDGSGNLISASDPLSQAMTYEYDGLDRMTRFYRPQNPVDPYVINNYDSLGRVMDQTDPVGNTWQYFIAGLRAEEENPLGDSLVWNFDRLGQTILEVDQLGNETSFEYDGHKRLVRRTYPEENATEYEYDTNHNPTKVTLQPKPGSSEDPIVTDHTYDATYGKVETTTTYDPAARLTTFTYDGNGNLTQIDRPAAGGTPTLLFTYNARGQIETHTDPEGVVTRYVYDVATGDLLSTILDDGGLAITSQMTYDAVGDLDQITDPRGNVTSYQFDGLRHVTQIDLPAPFGYQTRHQYDDNGNLVLIEQETGDGGNPWQTTVMTYTLADRLANETNEVGHTTTYEYDAMDRRFRVTNAEAETKEYLYDPVGRLETALDGRGVATEERTYTPNGQAASLEDGNDEVTLYTWDDFDRLERVTFPDGSFEGYVFDEVGNLLQKRTRSGQTLDFVYDALNRVTDRIVPGPGGRSVQYAYDLTGRLTQVTDGSGPTTYVYDDAGRPTQVTYPGSEVLGYAYDAMGNRTRLDYSDGSFVTYVYDNLNRMTEVQDELAMPIATYTYDSLSRRTLVTYANGASSTFQFEDDNDLMQIDHQFTSSMETLAYAYDMIGRRTSLSAGGDTTTYTYDDAHQLEDVTRSSGLPAATTYSYDGAGNRMSVVADAAATTYTSNVVNQYTAVGGRSLSYDGNGNLRNTGFAHYSYDAENRLILALGSAGRTRYAYDAFGRRTLKRTRVLPVGPQAGLAPASNARELIANSTTTYLYDEDRVIEEFDGLGAQTAKYVYGSRLDEPLTITTPSGTFFYHYDALGSVVHLSDAAGELAESYLYDEYGRVEAPSALGNPYLFTGRRHDSETGLYYYRARYYDPVLGRFLQTDPVGYADGMNTYRYVQNSPTNFVDPTGEWLLIDNLIAAGVGAAGGLIGQGISDLISGEVSSWETYAGSAAGGIVAAEVALHTGNPWLAGAAGGQASALTKQGLENLSSYVTTGEWSGFDGGDVISSTIFGGVTGGILGKVSLDIPGITSGRNSYGAIYKQIITKLENGTIKNVSASTIAKMLGYQSVLDLPATLLGGEIDAIKRGIEQILANK